jgi:fumarate reductase flavoprotein subunit
VAELFDVVIVGGGGSCLAAAVSAAEQGLRVMVLEKEAALGGTTAIAVGSFTACQTELQRNVGIDDNVDEHAEDAGRFAPPRIEACNNDELRRWFLSQSAETLIWLQGIGLSFTGPSPEPPNRVPRMHNVVPGARAYVATLHERLQRLGGRVSCNARVVALTRSDSGRVTGVIAEVGVSAEREVFSAHKGVVLAAGDYTGSAELLGRHVGESFRDVEGINPKSTGDGHVLAEREGGRLVNMEIAFGPELRFFPSSPRGILPWLSRTGLLTRLPKFLTKAIDKRTPVTWQHPEDALFDDGAILVNLQGERYCEEGLTPEREIATARQPGKVGYVLLDESLMERYSAWPHFISTAPGIAYAYVADYLRLRPDVAVQGSSIESVAAARGLNSPALEEAARSAGLKGERWLLLGPSKAYFTTTEGGAAIDRQFRVLNQQDKPIPGLYAIGQNGLGGQILWGHGLHIAWAMTSGRLVGQQLAAGAA